MSKSKAFLLSCLIYVLTILIFILLINIFAKNEEVIKYGNSEVDILFVEDNVETPAEVKQDYTKEVAKKINKSPENTSNDNATKDNQNKVIEQNEKVKQQTDSKDSDSDLSSLFGDLKVSKSERKNPKKETKQEENKLNQSQLDALKKIQSQLANTTIKSNNNSETTQTSAKVSGIYDEYFGRVNAYLKNVWSLVTANSSDINDKEIFEVAFTISKNGIIKIKDNGFNESSVLRQKARIFIQTINQQNKNLGIPPNQQDYSGSLRLSVILSIKEIK